MRAHAEIRHVACERGASRLKMRGAALLAAMLTLTLVATLAAGAAW